MDNRMSTYTNVTPGPLAIDEGYLAFPNQGREIPNPGEITKAHIEHGRLVKAKPEKPATTPETKEN